jgi:hypothetical protein
MFYATWCDWFYGTHRFVKILGGKLGNVVCYIEIIDAPSSLEHQHLLEVHCILGHDNRAFYKMHLYDKFLNIWPGATL